MDHAPFSPTDKITTFYENRYLKHEAIVNIDDKFLGISCIRQIISQFYLDFRKSYELEKGAVQDSL